MAGGGTCQAPPFCIRFRRAMGARWAQGPMPQPTRINRYTPISTSPAARKRFITDRQRRYLGRLEGRPCTDRIAQLIDHSRAEWDLHVGEATLAPLREVREARKAVYFWSAALERALKELPKKPAGPSLAEYLAAKAAAGGAT